RKPEFAFTELETFEAKQRIQQKFTNFQLGTDPLTGEPFAFDPVTGGINTVSTSTGETIDIGNYATDPNHTTAVQNILDAIGQFETAGDITSYIQSVAPNSPITSDMIEEASQQAGVSWESIVAMLQQESNLGTSNVAQNNNNVGGITWNGKNGIKGTARPAAEGGNYVRYNSLQEGINVVAQSLAGRMVSPGEQPTGQAGYQPTGNAVLDGLVQGALRNKDNFDNYTSNQKTAVNAALAKQGLSLEVPVSDISPLSPEETNLR
ncbi:unnamed protein product, partial [marine sediment metagenome]